MCLGIPAVITKIIDEDNFLAQVEVGQVSRHVNVMMVADKFDQLQELLGHWVIIHVGFAMSIIDEEQANETLALLEQMSIGD